MRMRTMLVSRAFPAMLFGAATLSCGGGRHMLTPPNPLTVGDLPHPVATMTADQLWTAGQDLGWIHGRRQDRDCARGNCKGRIDAVAGQQPPGAGLISPNGTIVGRFVNKGGFLGRNQGPENLYNFAKRNQSEFYLIAIQNSSAPGGWSWIVREARAGDSGTTPLQAGSWVTCRADDGHNPGHPPPGTKSEFYKCLDGAQNGSGTTTLMLYSRTDPGWLDCDQGCCSAGS